MTKLTQIYRDRQCLKSSWRIGRFILIGLIFSLAACGRSDSETVVVTRLVIVEGQEKVVTQVISQTKVPTPEPIVNAPLQPVVLDLSHIGNFPNIDPQLSTEDFGIDLIENIFVGLTNYNHLNNIIEPELARSWEVSENGRVWTFHLRDDIFWVHPDEANTIVDGIHQAEAVRPVVADDVVYAVQRVCHTDSNAPDAFILFLIEGCEQVHTATNPTPADLAAIGVQALDDFTLQFTLNKPASYFLTITSLWLFHPIPSELVDDLEEKWLTADPLLTSGPFLPISFQDSENQTILHRNSFWPILGSPNANVDIVNILYFGDPLPAYQLWEAKGLDISPIPAAEREVTLSQYQQKIQLDTELATFYLGFNFDSGVFREPGVRRAFSAAIDRDRLVDELYEGTALGMRHLMPPGVTAGPPIDRIGVGYSPDDARQWLAESGFQSCRLMPPITFLVTTSDLSLRQAELIRDMWVEELGCASEQIIIEQTEFGSLLANTRRDAGAARPDVWELAWASYYPDAQNWMGDLLHCTDGGNRQNRPCSEVDNLIRQAAGTLEYQDRVMLYRQIEDEFFGGDGIVPIVPLFVRGEEFLVHSSWLNFVHALFGGEQYDTYVINVEQKELERELERGQ